MKQFRIIKNEYSDGNITYVIQRRFAGFLWWCKLWIFQWSTWSRDTKDTHKTLEDAIHELSLHDGTVKKSVVKLT